MTNREWYLNKLNAMTNEEFANYIEGEVVPWCKTCYCKACCPDNCAKCAKEWLDKTHQEPMPELKDGMFVEIKLTNNVVLGVVVNNKIILQNGQWCNATSCITKVFDTCCFNLCDDSTCIWRKE